MARGDQVTVTTRTPVGTEKTVVVAQKDGAKVVIIEPRGNELYLAVEEQNRNDVMQRRFLFAKGEVLVVETGHVAIARKRGSK